MAAAVSTSVQLVNVAFCCALADCKRADDSRMKEWDSFMMVSYKCRGSWLAFACLLAMLSCW